MHVPARPGIAGQLIPGQNPQQPVRGIRHGGFPGKPVPHGARRDVKKFPDRIDVQARIHAQQFEASVKLGAGLRAVAGWLHPLSVCSTNQTGAVLNGVVLILASAISGLMLADVPRCIGH